MLVGATWIWQDSDCKEDFENGYYLGEAIVLAYFALVAVVLIGLCGVLCFVCFGAFHIHRMLDENE